VSIVTGIFLILIGIMLFTGTMTRFATLASFAEAQAGIDQWVVDFWARLTGQGG
jgi:uncharacterized membrane protein YphA (DoxX/SURF4 family)